MRLPWTCLDPVVLASGVGEGLTRWSRFHLDRCARCRSAFESARRLLETARDLPVAEMGAGTRGRIADRIVAAALRIDAEKARDEMRRSRGQRGREHGSPVSYPNH
jgi:hypothetical protein